MNISFLGQFIHFDIESNNLLIHLDYLDPDTQKKIEEAVTSVTNTKFTVALKPRRGKQYYHQKAWYGSLKRILQCQGIEATSFNISAFDEEMRKTLFPITYCSLGEKRIPLVSRMSDMTAEEIEKRIEILHERYSYLKDSHNNPIDFTDLKG